jgi:hypothetical protein
LADALLLAATIQSATAWGDSIEILTGKRN